MTLPEAWTGCPASSIKICSESGLRCRLVRVAGADVLSAVAFQTKTDSTPRETASASVQHVEQEFLRLDDFRADAVARFHRRQSLCSAWV